MIYDKKRGVVDVRAISREVLTRRLRQRLKAIRLPQTVEKQSKNGG